MSTWICIQARSGSSRLPQKTTRLINDLPMMDYSYTACKKAHPSVVFLVPETDQHIISTCQTYGYPYFTGPEDDVLRRHYNFMLFHHVTGIVRVTSDCPLINPANISHTLHLARDGADFVSNCMGPCVDGQEVEYISRAALTWANQEAEGEDREHVTTHIKKNLNSFRKAGFTYLSWGDYFYQFAPKMSVDTKEDFKRIVKIMEE